MLELLSNPAAWIAFLTLTGLELVLGIDNIIFISILVDKLPAEKRESIRKLGLSLALVMRIGLLLVLSWIVGLVAPIVTLYMQDGSPNLIWGAQPAIAGLQQWLALSGRDLILIAGGLFLIWKSVGEVHQLMEGEAGHASSKVGATVSAVIVQIVIIDMIFSLDSIITAVGMVNEIAVMIAAVIASVGLMMAFAAHIGRFVSQHPTIKMLALSFLIVIGVTLLLEGFGNHVPKGYIYFAMFFSIVVEMLNIRMRKKAPQPVRLHEPYTPDREKRPDDGWPAA
jgi:predicted tellurium resistance membrane protein TerC